MSSDGYQTVLRVGEIAEGRGVSVEVGGRVIAVFLDEGTYYALDDFCPHKSLPLNDGLVFDRSVTCLAHGWRFGLDDGCWTENPEIRTASYPVRVVGDEIQVDPG